MAPSVRALLLLSCWAAFLCVAGCGGPVETPDAGPSDAASDGNVDGGASCATDATCDDGLFCNGTERCTAGRCAAGAVPDCADGPACTRDQCSEDRRACVHAVPDGDLDGHGDAACVDGAGVALGDDCDDGDATAFPGAIEICDAAGHDEDCDVLSHGRVDADSDGFEDARCCNGTSCGTDCNDGARGANPDASEVCNGVDDDCDTRVDELVSVAGFADEDRDGFGDDTRPVTRCGDAVGFSTRPGDCVDTDIEINRGQLELCDLVDNDCDARIDEMAGDVTWYVDGDGDGYGTSGTTLRACSRPVGYSILGSDCDDSTSSRSPRAAEVCNGTDDDCNGRADYALSPGDLEDDDGDRVADEGCGLPHGLDCDDYSVSVLPGATEACNGLDDDCDASTDESATSVTFHRDADGDGYGDRGTAVIGCFAPSGYVADATDCDDRAAGRHPGAVETCDAIDGDCDRRIDETPAESTCSIAHGSALCTIGLCTLDACDDFYADCTPLAGCETRTLSDPAHCGGCAPCSSGESCVAGACVAGSGVGLIASTGDDAVTAVATASDGSFAVLGRYSGAYGGECGDLPFSLNANGFIERHSPGGGCAYVVGLDGSADERITGAALDAAGNLYVTMNTTSSTVLVTSGGSITMAAGQGAEDAIVFSLGPTGALRWSFRFGGTGDDRANGVAVSGANVFAACGVVAPVALDATHSFAAGDGSRDACVLQLSASTGSVIASTITSAAGSAADDESLAIDVEALSGDALVAGMAFGPIAFGGAAGTLTPVGASDGFVWRVEPTTLASVWAFPVRGPSGDVASAISVSAGAPYVGGRFVGSVMMGTSALTAHGGPTDADGFVFGFDLTTGEPFISTRIGGPGGDQVSGLDADPFAVAVVGTMGPGYTDIGGFFTEGMGGRDGFAISLDPFMGYAFRGTVLAGSADSFGHAVSAYGSSVLAGGSFDGALRIAGQSYSDPSGGTDGVWLLEEGSLK